MSQPLDQQVQRSCITAFNAIQPPAHISPSDQTINPHARGIGLFLWSAMAIVAVTLAAKISTLAQKPPLLDHIDAITNLRFKELMILAASVEFVILVAMVLSKSQWWKAISLLLFASNIAIYRILSLQAQQQLCPCLGNFGSIIKLTNTQTNVLLNSIAIYLFIGAALTVYLLPPPNRRPAQRPPS